MPRAEITELTIGEVHQMYEAKELTCQQLVDRYLDRIEAYDRNGPELNAVITVNPDAAERAAELDEAFEESGPVGPLHGIPVAVKDQVETADITTTFGSEAFAKYTPANDATIITKLREAGAVILAKTTLPDWATSTFGYSSVAGRTKNPYALDRDPGGSSSGTGVAVAANLGTIGIGEDTGGSILIPSAYNNLFGIRVTPGLISRTGMSPLIVSRDTAGPMTRTAEELATVLDVVVGYHAADEYTAGTAMVDEAGSYADVLDADAFANARIGVLRNVFGDDDDPDAVPVNRRVEAAIETMDDLGAEFVDPVRIPDLDAYLEETALLFPEMKRNLNGFLSARPDAPVDSVMDLYESGQYHEIPLFGDIAEDGPEDPEEFPDYWRKVAAQPEFQRKTLTLYAEHDLDALLCPIVQVIPPMAEAIEAGEMDIETFPYNTTIVSNTGCCGVSVPAGLTEHGYPVGVELIGKPYDEARLLSLAFGFDRATELREPPETAPSLG